jgi:hypothetical protein
VNAAAKTRLLLAALRALPAAWRARCTRDLASLRLPPVNPGPGMSDADLAWAARMAGAMARWGAPRLGRRCFFRSCVLATVLRRRGLPARLNVGLRRIGSDATVSGHCWVTLADGPPVAEPEGVLAAYPQPMGEGANGVRYWAGA